jgi:hypothetical protein
VFQSKSFLPKSFSPKSWEFGDLVPAEDARTAGGTVQLKRIHDAKVTAYGAASVTRAGRITAVGEDFWPQIVVIPAQGYARGKAAATRTNNAQASAAATCYAGHTTCQSYAATLDASAAATGYALSASHLTHYADPAYAASSSASLRGNVAITSGNDATARGQKRLTTKQIVALTRL